MVVEDCSRWLSRGMGRYLRKEALDGILDKEGMAWNKDSLKDSLLA